MSGEAVDNELITTVMKAEGRNIDEFGGYADQRVHTQGQAEALSNAKISEKVRSLLRAGDIAGANIAIYHENIKYVQYKLQEFTLRVFPGPLTFSNSSLRNRMWRLREDFLIRMYDHQAKIFDDLLTMSSDDALKLENTTTLGDHLRSMGFSLEYKADGSLRKVHYKPVDSRLIKGPL